jgi:hypothetical protein
MAAKSSSDLFEELRDVDVRVLERALECVSIDFIVKGEDNSSSVRMFHLHVATLAMNLYETEALQGCELFPTREQG